MGRGKTIKVRGYCIGSSTVYCHILPDPVLLNTSCMRAHQSHHQGHRMCGPGGNEPFVVAVADSETKQTRTRPAAFVLKLVRPPTSVSVRPSAELSIEGPSCRVLFGFRHFIPSVRLAISSHLLDGSALSPITIPFYLFSFNTPSSFFSFSSLCCLSVFQLPGPLVYIPRHPLVSTQPVLLPPPLP
jgi:hypothetical protein